MGGDEDFGGVDDTRCKTVCVNDFKGIGDLNQVCP